MSETNKKTKNNPAIACADIKTDGKQLIIEQGKYGPSRDDINELAGIEIKLEDATVTNETPEGRIAVRDEKTGDVIGYLDNDGTIKRKLGEIDKSKKEEGPEK